LNSLSLCTATNLQVSPSSYALLHEFCRCPSAADLLDNTADLYKSLSIDTGNYPTSNAQTSGLALVNVEKLDPKTAAEYLQFSIEIQTYSIFINAKEKLNEEQEDLNSKLRSLAFELNNGLQKKTWNDRVIAAYKGKLSRDDFAIQTEKMEYTSGLKTEELLVECHPFWKVKNLRHSVADNFEDNLFSQEIHGHTDFMRKRWDECCKQTYCAKHANDQKSCAPQEEERMNYYNERSLGDEERKSLQLERIKANFHKASPRPQ